MKRGISIGSLLILAVIISAFVCCLQLGIVEAQEGETPVPASEWVEMDGDEVESQLALYPNDEQETENLKGPRMVFSDFCTSSRDAIMGDMKRSLNGLVGGMLKLFLNSFEALGIDEKKVSQEAEQEEQKKSTLSGSAGSVPSELSGNTQGGVSGDSTLEHKQGGGGFFLFGAIVSAISAVGNTVGGVVLDRLQQMGSVFGLDKLQAALGNTCDQIGNYERSIRKRFEAVRAEVGELDPSLAEVELEDLGCLTVGRLLRLQGVCRVGDSIQQHPLLSLLLKSNNALQFVAQNRNIQD